MCVFAPDTDIVSYLVRSGEAPALRALGRQPILATDTVWSECAVRRTWDGGTDAAERVALVQAWTGGFTMLPVGTPEAASAAKLLGPGDLQAGEVSIIAWSMHHPEVVPVLHDRQALYRALEELPFRAVLSFHGFLGLLRACGLADAAASRASKSYCERGTWPKAARPHAPTWW